MMAKKTDPSDDYTQVFAQMLAENTKAARAVVDGALQEHDRVAAEQLTAKAHLETIKSQKKEIVEKHFQQALAQLKKAIAAQETEALAVRLLEKGMRATDVAALLDLPDAQVKSLTRQLRIHMIDQKDARITYENAGRGGYILVSWNQITNRFYWEFGGGNALAIIDIPTSDHWEKQTSWPAAKRTELLEFIARQVIEDQASGHQYRMDENAVVILR